MDTADVVRLCNGILFSHKKNEILPFETTWRDMEGIMSNERNQMR